MNYDDKIFDGYKNVPLEIKEDGVTVAKVGTYRVICETPECDNKVQHPHHAYCIRCQNEQVERWDSKARSELAEKAVDAAWERYSDKT